MKRHSGSKQKPVPNLPSMLRPRNFNSVIGTTVLLKSCAYLAVEGVTNGNRSERSFWAHAREERHELAIKIGITLRKTIRHHRDSGRVSADVLHALHHRLRAERKGFSET